MTTWNVTFNIPTAKAADVRDTVAKNLNYQEKIEDPEPPHEDIDNPQSKADFIYEKMKDWLKENYKAGKVAETNATVQQAREDADAVDITVE